MSERIVILTHDFHPRLGGIATYIDATARAAVAAGHDVTVWAPARPELAAFHAPYAIEPMPVAGNQGIVDRLRLLRFLSRNRAKWSGDNTILYLPEPAPLRLLMHTLAHRLPLPPRIVVTLHGSEINTLARFPHRRLAATLFFNRCERIGFVSQAMEQLFIRRFPRVATERIQVPGALRAGIDTPVFAHSRACARSATPPDAPLNVITVARLHPRKGHDRVIRALAALPAALRARVRYTVVGPVARPRYLRELQSLARTLGVPVDFAGAVDDRRMAQYLGAADVFVLAARSLRGSIEGLGLAILEAQAASLPVIATDSGGVPEAFAPDLTGLLVPADDAPALAGALARLLGDPALRQRFGAAGPAWVRDHFSWENNVDRLFAPAARI